jgi:hypothetical protein
MVVAAVDLIFNAVTAANGTHGAYARAILHDAQREVIRLRWFKATSLPKQADHIMVREGEPAGATGVVLEAVLNQEPDGALARSLPCGTVRLPERVRV